MEYATHQNSVPLMATYKHKFTVHIVMALYCNRGLFNKVPKKSRQSRSHRSLSVTHVISYSSRSRLPYKTLALVHLFNPPNECTEASDYR